jgi:hypothetical protein
MCTIVDVVCLGRGCICDCTIWLPDSLVAGEVHDIYRNTEKEYARPGVSDLYRNCYTPQGIPGGLGFGEYEVQAADLKIRMVKATARDLRV